MRDNGRVSDQPGPRATPGSNESVETVDTVGAVTVRRAPKFYRFMAVGAVVGLLITLILVFSFPEQEDFTPLQVVGFTAIFVVAICVALGALVALILDRASRKRSRTVRAERIEEREIVMAEQIVDSTAETSTRADAAQPAVTFAASPADAPASPVAHKGLDDDEGPHEETPDNEKKA